MNTESMIELIVEQAIWDGIAGSSHGEAHWLRVFKLADKMINRMALMVKGNNKLVVNRGVVGFAALLHDVGRVHDGRDPAHGYRGASTAVRVATTIYASGKNQWDLILPKDFHKKVAELGMIADIVNRHCLKGPGDYLEMQIVKDADKLDRVRFSGKRSVDVDRLALDVSRDMVEEAVELYEESRVAEV